MFTLLTLFAPKLPLDCVWKLFAALVLFAVSVLSGTVAGALDEPDPLVPEPLVPDPLELDPPEPELPELPDPLEVPGVLVLELAAGWLAPHPANIAATNRAATN